MGIRFGPYHKTRKNRGQEPVKESQNEKVHFAQRRKDAE